MKKLDSVIRKSIFTYELVDRTESRAIYSQSYDGKIISWEVFKIKIAKDGEILGRFIEGGERFPSDNDFGVTAWSINNFDKAMMKYNELCSQETH